MAEEKKEEGQTFQYVYLLRTREFVKSKTNVYKYGKTLQRPDKRMAGYPKDSEILLILEVQDCDFCERKIKDQFQISFKATTYGSEYFEGDPLKMREIIFKITQDNFPSPDVSKTPMIVDYQEMDLLSLYIIKSLRKWRCTDDPKEKKKKYSIQDQRAREDMRMMIREKIEKLFAGENRDCLNRLMFDDPNYTWDYADMTKYLCRRHPADAKDLHSYLKKINSV
jgi:hypothetical protein